METVWPLERTVPLLMDRAYEDDRTRFQAWGLWLYPVVPPKRNWVKGWDYDEKLYQRRNEVERLFQRIKRFLSVFTRYEKLNRMVAVFVFLAFICIALRCVNTP